MSRKTNLINKLIDVLWAGAHYNKTKPCSARPVIGREFINNKYENAFFNRIVGFTGEINYLQRSYRFKNTLAGGWFIPFKWSENPDYTKSTVYITVLPEITGNYQYLYDLLRKAIPEIDLYALTYSPITDNFQPRFKIYRFEDARFTPDTNNSFWKKFKAKHKDYCLETLRETLPRIPDEIRKEAYKRLYVEEVDEEIYESIVLDRIFFDEKLSGTYKKGRPTDIDAIQLNPFKKEILFIDVKEKYANGGKVGINDDHLPFFMQMKNCFSTLDDWKFDSRYLLRLTRSATDHSFCGWYQKSIEDFIVGDNAGGNDGQNGSSAQRTRNIPVEEMKKV